MCSRFQSAFARLGAAAALILGLSCGTARAADDACSARHSSCLESNQQWLPFRPGPFATIDGDFHHAHDAVAATLAASYQHEPLTLEAASPDPAGRFLPLVEHVVDMTMLLDFALSERADLGVALAMVPYQKGLGIDAARSRSSSGLERTAVRDPRLGVGYTLFESYTLGSVTVVRARGDLTLPLGDSRSFTRDAGPVAGPGAALVTRFGRFNFGLDLSARFRQSVTLADVRYGSQLVSQLGIGVSLLDQDWLRASAETSWFWSLARETKQARQTALLHLPAEWLLGIASRVGDASSLGLYGGAGLPVSTKDVDLGAGRSEHESFAGLGAPDLRLLLLFVQAGPRAEQR